MSALPARAISYARESIRDLKDEVLPLLQAHWREIAFYPDIPLNPRWDAYFHAEDSGSLRCYSVRDRGVLIGYAAFFLNPSLHYGGSLQAAQDVIYVDPMYRNGRIGLGLIRHCEHALRAEGCQLLMQHAKADQKHVFGAVLQRLGYDVLDVIYSKRLDR
jgi:GNAT superfamily N-acetyltransferase